MRIIRIRNLRSIIFLALLSIFTFSVGIVDAKTQYVSDELVITMREGKGNEYKIVKMLTAGTPLEIIEESQNYLRVRTQDGKEGWVLKQYITSETPKAKIIAGLEQEIVELKTELERYKRDKDSLQNELKTAKSGVDAKIRELNQSISLSREGAEKTAKQLQEISKKYDTLVEQSKDVTELMNERDKLRTLNGTLSAETEHLREENSRLKRLQILWWFLAGAGVFFIGWITGRVSRKRKYY
jgi:SH3 domain protein